MKSIQIRKKEAKLFPTLYDMIYIIYVYDIMYYMQYYVLL